jgi:protein-disulfide isomerase/uncharacterized membrane protein
MTAKARTWILGLALLGLGLASYSSWVHYKLLTDASYTSPCDLSAKLSCSTVYMSRFGSVAGVPVALGGVFWFGLVALIAGFAKPGKESAAAGGYIFGLATIGLAVILYLGYASFFILKTGCVLCIGTYVAVIGIFVIAGATGSVSMTRLPLQLFSDLRAILTRPTTMLAGVVFVAGTASLVAFFPKEGVPPPPPPQAAKGGEVPADIKEKFTAAWNALPKVDLGIPPAGAKVVVVKFNDYECPMCRTVQEWYKPVFEKFERLQPGSVKFVVKDWPWDTSCNFNAGRTISGHEASCFASAAARMAKDRNKFPEMEAWLFGNQGTTQQKVREAAKAILNINVADFDREYAKKLPEIRRDVSDGGALKIVGTPTFFINGIRIPNESGTLPPEYFELALQIEMKKAGA